MIRSLIAFLLLLATPLIAAFDNQVVEKLDIQIQNGQDVNPEDVKTRLLTRVGDFFSQNSFDTDLKNLSKDFSRVDPSVKHVGGKLQITLILIPKPEIHSLTYEGNCKVDEATLATELGIGPGALFDRMEFNKAFHKLKAYYVKNGFFEAELEYVVRQNQENGKVDIVVSIREGRSGKIRKICFQNFSKSEQTEILNAMCTKPYNLFLSWFSGTGTYNEEMIQQDRFMILNYLQNKGYADATCTIEIQEVRNSNRIDVIICCDRGPRYYFGDITFEGNTLFSDEAVSAALKAKEGCPYSQDILNDSVRGLMNLYGRCGYIDSFANFLPTLDEDGRHFSVHFTIEEGEQFCVGLIKVFGNCTTQTKVILHETLLTPGEVFNSDRLKQTETRLRNIGYFKNVNVYAVKTDSESILPGCYRDVHIEVEETGTGHLGASFGLSSIEDIFGGVNITERNFNICGFRRLFCDGYQALRGGGEYAHISANIGSKSLSYNASWTKPHFMDTPWTLGVDLEKSTNRYVDDDYTLRNIGGQVSLGYQYNAFLRGALHYRIKHSNDHVRSDCCTIEEAEIARDAMEKKRFDKIMKSKSSEDYAPLSHGTLGGGKNLCNQIGLTSAIGGSWSYDSTDSIVNPTCGFRSRFEEEIAGIGGDIHFISFAYLNTYYYNIRNLATLKLRCDLKFMQRWNNDGINDIPLDERFFLGGDWTIRGYRPYSPGPKYTCAEFEVIGPGKVNYWFKKTDDPFGGYSMQFYSAEIARPIFGKLDGFVFADAGFLSEREWAICKPWVSVGFGFRFELMENTPPVMFGMGFPLNPQSSSDVKKFFFQMGGKF